MSYVMRVVALGSGAPLPEDMGDETYVKTYEPEAMDGHGLVDFTADATEAQQFETPGAAMALWRTIPETRPTRSDGQPNRPLTAFSIEVFTLESVRA